MSNDDFLPAAREAEAERIRAAIKEGFAEVCRFFPELIKRLGEDDAKMLWVHGFACGGEHEAKRQGETADVNE